MIAVDARQPGRDPPAPGQRRRCRRRPSGCYRRALAVKEAVARSATIRSSPSPSRNLATTAARGGPRRRGSGALPARPRAARRPRRARPPDAGTHPEPALMRAIWLREFGPPSVLDARRGARPAGDVRDRGRLREHHVRRDEGPRRPRAVQGQAADDPRQRRRRRPERPARGRLDRRLGRLRRAGRGRRLFEVPEHRDARATRSRCWPTAARRRCSPRPRRSAGRTRARPRGGGRRRHAARPTRAAAGAHVVAAASTERKRDLARSLGADAAVDYVDHSSGTGPRYISGLRRRRRQRARDAFERLAQRRADAQLRARKRRVGGRAATTRPRRAA